MPKKIALVIGIDYVGTNVSLQGCVNDAEAIKDVLHDKLGFEEIILLTDHTPTKPTKHNIMKALVHLVDRSWDDDVREFWISYAGHGSYKLDTSGDEDDQRDECLVPLDWRQSGKIDDDTLNHTLGLMNPACNISVVVDACHSSTMLDLPFRYLPGKQRNVEENAACHIKCNVVCLSACRDTQTAGEVYDAHTANEYAGALTADMLAVLEKYDYTVQGHVMIIEIRKRMKARKFRQVPQLSCTHEMSPAIFFCISNPQGFVSYVITK